VVSGLIWIWVVIELKDRKILSINISKEGTYVFSNLIYFKCYKRVWKTSYFHRCGGYMISHQTKILKLTHIFIFVYNSEKGVIERIIQYRNDRTKENFDDCFFCKKNKYKKHVKQWLNLFIGQCNKI
jgi:putative transposase